MNEPNYVSGDRLCVSFSEAINWIAFSNFGGSVIGPQRIFGSWIEQDQHQDSYLVASGRQELAHELLLSYAAQGKIKIYARSWTKQGKEKEERVYIAAVPPEFIANSHVDYEEAEGLTTLIENFHDEKDEYEYYTPIVVDYEDLTSNFWGKDQKFNRQIDAAARGESSAPESAPYSGPSRRGNRRGRPMKHKWSELTAATVERCLKEPITKQEDLVRKMLEWCAENWGEEPSLSDVRAYVAPIFRQFDARWSETSATGVTEKSEP